MFRYTGLILKRLDKKDISILLILCLCVSIPYFNFIGLIDANLKVINSWISVWVYIIVIIVGMRFKNFLFSVIWFLLTLQYFLFNNINITLLPLIGFSYYHILRLIFWMKNSQEFIPLYMGFTYAFRNRYSKIDNRYSHDDDKIFSVFLYIGLFGFLCFMAENKSYFLNYQSPLNIKSTTFFAIR